jgi:NAD(P)-dependent dehydrogenase (short-subunit alcohol dehydrogenase family)
MNLKSRIAVVTGAASGIGGEIASTFWVDDAKVVVADLNQADAAAAAAEFGDADSAIGIGMDVTDETQVEVGMAAVVAAFRGIDMLVSNAGIHLAADRPVGAAETGIRRLRKPCLLPGRLASAGAISSWAGSPNGSEIAASEKRERFRIGGTRSKRAPITPQAA